MINEPSLFIVNWGKVEALFCMRLMSSVMTYQDTDETSAKTPTQVSEFSLYPNLNRFESSKNSWLSIPAKKTIFIIYLHILIVIFIEYIYIFNVFFFLHLLYLFSWNSSSPVSFFFSTLQCFLLSSTSQIKSYKK